MQNNQQNSQQNVRTELESLADVNYREFASKLIPNCENLIGVRIPEIRKIAKRIAGQNAFAYLHDTQEIYFEEIMLKGLIIGNLKIDIESLLQEVEFFVPKINNWSVCDSFAAELKIIKQHKGRVWEFLQPYWQSERTYFVRFALVVFLFYFVEENYLQKMFEIFEQISNRDYYVKMAIAWAISICFVKFPHQTMDFLKTTNLEKQTYNKALQKIRESTRTDKPTKELIKTMKR